MIKKNKLPYLIIMLGLYVILMTVMIIGAVAPTLGIPEVKPENYVPWYVIVSVSLVVIAFLDTIAMLIHIKIEEKRKLKEQQ